jgi:hypothetical protein
VVPLIQGSLDDIKRMRDECAAADLRVAIEAVPGGGPAPRFALVVEEEDAARAVEILRSQWRAELDREGVAPAAPMGIEAVEGEEPPCPACGTAAPLVDGACSECGLQLE